MKRRAALINKLDNFKSDFPLEFDGIDINAVELYLDVTDIKDRNLIVRIMSDNKQRFKLIIRLILQGLYDKYLYRKEKGKVTAMKLKNNEHNSRIYCLEVPGTNKTKKKIVMARGLLDKTSEKNDNKNNPIINSVNNYEYEYFKTRKEAIEYRRKTR